jgi:asparagine synthase (glutamine-hydrolysing)
MGIKPFYYHLENGVFTFCSEIKGMIKQPAVKKQVSKDGLRLFLSYGYVGAPYTILDDVFALKPGECFKLSNKKLIIEQYWYIPIHTQTELSYQEAKDKLKQLVVDKVNEEMVSDVPLGLFLSGGLDSTVVLAAMRLSGKEQIETFSLGFEGFEASEEEEAEIAAKHFNTKHHTHIISGKTVAQEFDGFIDAMDQPCIDGLNVYLVSKYTKQNVTVALSGLGPDELFLGWGPDFYTGIKAQEGGFKVGVSDNITLSHLVSQTFKTGAIDIKESDFCAQADGNMHNFFLNSKMIVLSNCKSNL